MGGHAVRPLALAAALATVLAAPLRGQEADDVNAATAAAVQSLQQRILADPRLAANVEALREDAQVRAILADPAIAAAIARGDVGALLAHPGIRRLADDPAVQDVTRQIDR
jgi:hypothetical protein